MHWIPILLVLAPSYFW